MKNSKKRYNLKDLSLFLAIAIVTAIAFFCTYYFEFSSPIKVLIWIAWLVSCGLLGFFTTTGKQILIFAEDAKAELFKVVWPTRQETIQTTSIVMIMVTVTGFILWGIDSGMMWMIAKITHLG